MVSQSSCHHGSSLDAPLATLVSNSRLPKIRFRRLRQKFSLPRWQTSAPINTSSTTVNSSDTSLKNGVPAVASGDLSYPWVEWGHQATPTPATFRPQFYKLLSRLSPQSASPNRDHYKTHGTTSHHTRSKKPEKAGNRRKSTSKGARDAGSGGGGKGGKGRGGSNGPPPDGHRFPSVGDTRPPKHFGCLFYMTDPLRHHQCSNLRLSRPSDVSQHIIRKHLLRDINLRRGTASIDTTEAEENVQQAGTCINADSIRRYHARCRMEFHGRNAEEKLLDHCRNFCPEAGIEDTGVMLPSEYQDLKDARDAVTGSVAKWYAMWGVCYPAVTRTTLTRFRTVPASPYVETTVPREQGEYVIRQALMSASTNQGLAFDQIVNGIYLGGVETDRGIQQIVLVQQRQRDLELRQALQSTSISSHLPSTGLGPWDLPLQEETGLQHATPFPSSSVTLPLQQHELLIGQSSNSITNSFASLAQQSQMPYRTTFPSANPSNFSLQPQMQPPYQSTSSNYTHPGSLPEASDPASQQGEWCWNHSNWDPGHFDGSQ
ncbi:hypothetical protein FACUT_13134 [Fusarium acutatum]|uniref:Uncharacterized protein n=1 Tax=Fusarium acutatum TaxID=78861 RepID=A0A8H4J9I7_9HYPO|nr:hypothetical protein FACUT_13134 [Fusarium acutatum]